MSFDDYPMATALDGSEKTLVKQGGATKGVTIQSIRDYLRAVSVTVSGTLKVMTGTDPWSPLQTVTVMSMKGIVGIAPTGADLVFKLLKNGTIIATGTIVVGNKVSSEVTGIDAALTPSDVLTLDITQVGSTIAGSGLRARITIKGA